MNLNRLLIALFLALAFIVWWGFDPGDRHSGSPQGVASSSSPTDLDGSDSGSSLEPIDLDRSVRTPHTAPPRPRIDDTGPVITRGAREIKSIAQLDFEQVRQRLVEVEAKVKRLRRELAPLTEQPYADMFDRGEFTATDDAPPIDNERLMAVRVSMEGRYHAVYLPREGFEYEYSLFDEIVRLGSERSKLEAELSRLRR